MSLMISSSCCCSADGTCCSTEVNTSASITDLIQCQSITIQNSGTCVANGGIVFVPGMGVNCEGQTCILKTVPLGQIIKHCLHTDVCAYDSFSLLVPDGADWYPDWGCGASSNYRILYDGTAQPQHREILWQPIGGTSGFAPVENQMEVACIPFSNLGDEPCYGNYYNHLSTSPAQPVPPNPQSRVYANTLKDRVTGTMTIETLYGTVAVGFVGDINRVGGTAIYSLYAASTCKSMLGSVLYTYTPTASGCRTPMDYCPQVTYRIGVAGGATLGNYTLHAPDATHTAYYCDAEEGYPVYLGYLYARQTSERACATGPITGSNYAWSVVLDGIGMGSGTSRPAYTGDLPYCLSELVYTCISRGEAGNYNSWAVSAGNPISEREALIGAPYEHFLGGNQTFVFRNPTANVSTTTTCGGLSHTEPVRTVTVEITGSTDWAIGGEGIISFPVSTPCEYPYDSRYPTQAAVSGALEITTSTHNACELSRFRIIAEYGSAYSTAAITGTGAGATYTTAKTKLSVPSSAAGYRPTIITYDIGNFGKTSATPLKKTYYDAFYVYGNPRLIHDTSGWNKHLDVTIPYAGIAGQTFSVTCLGQDFIGMKKAELRSSNGTLIATSTSITNTGINLDPANCKTVTVGFPSVSAHGFYYIYLFNNYIDRHATSNTIQQGVYVFGVPTANNTYVKSKDSNHNVDYNLNPNQSVVMGGTVQPFETSYVNTLLSWSKAPNQTASIVVDGVTILDNPNNDLPDKHSPGNVSRLGVNFGAYLPAQLVGTVGTQSVVFTTYGGSVTLSRRQAITPKITAVSDLVFPKSGGTTLTLTGLNLDLLSAFVLVYSNDLKSTCSIVSQSATSVVLTTGALTSQYAYQDPLIATYTLNLVATYASEPLLTWGSQTSYLGGFTFTMVSAPTITSVTPSTNLPIAGGTSVVIVGKHYVHMVSVTFKGVAVTPTINSALQMTCIAPANSVGSGQLVITTLGGSASFAITYV